MPFIPFPDGCAEVHLNGDIDTVPIQNTLGVKFVTGAATATDGAALLTAIDAYISASGWMANLCPNTGLDNLEIIDLTSISGWTSTLTEGLTGTHAAGQVQAQVAMVITLTTAKRGRSFRGRNYVGGLPAAALASPGTWGSVEIGVWEGLYSGLQAAIAAAGWTLVVLSRQLNNLPRTEGVATPVTAIRGNAKLGTIRGRLS
jgi:hypothetical protein